MLKLLKRFPEHYTNFFTEDDFLKLRKDRLIVAHLIGKDEYLMPCVLWTKEPEEVDQFRVITTGVAPLAIHFSCKLVPHCVFCSLLAFLQSSLNSSPWSLFPHPENSTEPQSHYAWRETASNSSSQKMLLDHSHWRILSLWLYYLCTHRRTTRPPPSFLSLVVRKCGASPVTSLAN